ncbi:hypothetical protein [Microcoleus sp. bin38.metabat.b11b12b14.051]|uniref:hypothetical protein n=1 Tax=Microcoleus sp. bin38.metabat.b11b12b14.051 TaxID=2742709 RepID=UPI0025FDF9FC|nr:hypothetical protein [Microcoleus sp. bin38.metabat.b11b12b14.051]
MTSPDLIDSATAESEGVSSVEESNFRDRAVSEYSPKGTARTGFSYFRFSYKDGSRTVSIHIPGGNVRSANAQSRAIEVRAKIAAGMPPEEIVKAIRKMSLCYHDSCPGVIGS